MSVLEPIPSDSVYDAPRENLQLSSSARRNEVNLDSNEANTARTSTADPKQPKSTVAASDVCSSQFCNDPQRKVRSTDYVAALRSAVSLIQAELLDVESALTDQLVVSPSAAGAATIQQMLDYVKELGGKRLRPSLTLLAAKACGGITPETIRLAASIELVHTATLVHDDIIDNADERRHRPTAHKLWGAHQSVLIGDWLFTHAYELANLGESTIPGRWISRAAKRVCEGEILQGQSVGRIDLSESQYFDILDAKTGALCEVSCRLGAWSAGANAETIEAFAQFGSKLGIAFQIYDDWLDIWGDPLSAGKTLGTDLISLKPTLPTIFAIQQCHNNAVHTEANDCFEMKWLGRQFETQESLRKELDFFQASQYTRDKANEIGAEAIESIQAMPIRKSLDTQAVDALSLLAYCATHRQA